MGPALDPQTLPDLVAACLQLCGTATPDSTQQLALAVELGPTALVSLVSPGEFGHRNSASLGTFSSSGPVVVRPDETVDASALADNARTAAEILATMLLRAFQHR